MAAKRLWGAILPLPFFGVMLTTNIAASAVAPPSPDFVDWFLGIDQDIDYDLSRWIEGETIYNAELNAKRTARAYYGYWYNQSKLSTYVPSSTIISGFYWSDTFDKPAIGNFYLYETSPPYSLIGSNACVFADGLNWFAYLQTDVIEDNYYARGSITGANYGCYFPAVGSSLTHIYINGGLDSTAPTSNSISSMSTAIQTDSTHNRFDLPSYDRWQSLAAPRISPIGYLSRGSDRINPLTLPPQDTSDWESFVDGVTNYIYETYNITILPPELDDRPQWETSETIDPTATPPEGNILPTIPRGEYEYSLPESFSQSSRFWWDMTTFLFDGLGITAVIVTILAVGIVLHYLLR